MLVYLVYYSKLSRLSLTEIRLFFGKKSTAQNSNSACTPFQKPRQPQSRKVDRPRSRSRSKQQAVESPAAVVHDTTSLMMVEDTEGCDLWEISKAESSRFKMETAPYRVSEVKSGWLQLGLLRSCCGEFRCQKTGGDVFLAYLDGKEAPKALAQPTIHDFGNGSYALLLPEETLLPSGTYSLQIYLHQALNRSFAHVSVASADVFGTDDSLDAVADLRLVYQHRPAVVGVVGAGKLLQWRWPGGSNFKVGVGRWGKGGGIDLFFVEAKGTGVCFF